MNRDEGEHQQKQSQKSQRSNTPGLPNKITRDLYATNGEKQEIKAPAQSKRDQSRSIKDRNNSARIADECGKRDGVLPKSVAECLAKWVLCQDKPTNNSQDAGTSSSRDKQGDEPTNNSQDAGKSSSWDKQEDEPTNNNQEAGKAIIWDKQGMMRKYHNIWKYPNI